MNIKRVTNMDEAMSLYRKTGWEKEAAEPEQRAATIRTSSKESHSGVNS